MTTTYELMNESGENYRICGRNGNGSDRQSQDGALRQRSRPVSALDRRGHPEPTHAKIRWRPCCRLTCGGSEELDGRLHRRARPEQVTYLVHRYSRTSDEMETSSPNTIGSYPDVIPLTYPVLRTQVLYPGTIPRYSTRVPSSHPPR